MLRKRFPGELPDPLPPLPAPLGAVAAEAQPIRPSTDSNAGGQETPRSRLHVASTELVHVAASHRVAPAAVMHEVQRSKLATGSDASGALPQTAPGGLSVPLATGGIRQKCKGKV